MAEVPSQPGLTAHSCFLFIVLCHLPREGGRSRLRWAPLDSCFSVTGGKGGRWGVQGCVVPELGCLSEERAAEGPLCSQTPPPGCGACFLQRRRGLTPAFQPTLVWD